MDKNEFTLRLTEIIMKDWREALNNSEEYKHRFNLPGDIIPMIERAVNLANEIANEHYNG